MPWIQGQHLDERRSPSLSPSFPRHESTIDLHTEVAKKSEIQPRVHATKRLPISPLERRAASTGVRRRRVSTLRFRLAAAGPYVPGPGSASPCPLPCSSLSFVADRL